MKKYTAYVTNKETKEAVEITSTYKNKKSFVTDLRANGYRVNPRMVQLTTFWETATDEDLENLR